MGKVNTEYLWLVDLTAPGCPEGDVLLATRAKVIVEGKGEIDVAVSALPDCFSLLDDMLHATQPFTITGGSGKYAGASGSGTIKHDFIEDVGGYDSWSGKLAVPGLDFDLTPPTLRGAVAKSVRVPRGKSRVRVTYRVTAADGIDGAVRVTCLPRSGSLFRIGRTTVTCSAEDRSGNTTSARFIVTARR